MSFGNILGQMMQGGLGGQATSKRVNSSAQNLGAGGGPIDGILSQIQGALGGAGGTTGSGGGGLGGLAEMAKGFLTKEQAGGMTGGQIGGIGAVAGALLGGGVGGAARGGALAMLGTLAVAALKNAQSAKAGGAAAPTIEPHEVAALTGPEAEKTLVRAMISAAKADGHIDQAEMQKIVGKISGEGVTDAEKAFVMSELSAPVDIDALAAEATSPVMAAEIYAASLFAIDVDSDAERDYLRRLAQALHLDAATVAQLHQMTDAPAA